jgi:CIC family chloride channel protein
MLAGFVAGFVALAFMLSLYRTEDLFDASPFPEWTRAAVGGLLVGIIGISLPNVFGVGYSSISAALANELAPALLGVLIVVKIAATSITIGSGGSGGIFAPSLFLGAMTGGFLGSFIHQWFPESTASSGAYALVTMGAVVAATTHAPITAIIMIFELTQTISIIPPLMAACVVSTLVTTYLQRDSIYTMKLRRRGIDLYQEEPSNVLKGLYVHDIIDREPETLPENANFQEVVAHALASEHNEFFVLDERADLRGMISLRAFTRMLVEKEALMPLVVARDLAEPGLPTVTENTDLGVVIQLFSGASYDEIAVVAEDAPTRLVGSVHKKDVISAYNQEVLRRDLAGSVSDNVLVASKGQQVALGGGYVLQEVQPPSRFFGQSLRDLDIAAKTGVNIVLLHKRDTSDGRPEIRVPTAADVIQEGDRLVISGTKSAVEGLDSI